MEKDESPAQADIDDMREVVWRTDLFIKNLIERDHDLLEEDQFEKLAQALRKCFRDPARHRWLKQTDNPTQCPFCLYDRVEQTGTDTDGLTLDDGGDRILYENCKCTHCGWHFKCEYKFVKVMVI